MNTSIARLESLVLAVLHSQTIADETAAAHDLADFYRVLVDQKNLVVSKNNESPLDGGLAISSHDAAICIDEPLRTSRFIKGVYAAIQELETRYPNEKLRVLYAGCGPFATLVFPLLPLLNLSHFELLFLDMHESSLACVEQLISCLGYVESPVQLIQADALSYRAEKPLHLVVTETMFYALMREPQVGITKNLAPQLLPDGILVPEAIHIDLVYTAIHQEHVLKNDGSPFVFSTQRYAQRHTVDRLFSITREPSFFDRSPNARFVSNEYVYASSPEIHPHICIFTEVKIFGDIVLSSAESTITNPYCLISAADLKHSSFSLQYSFDQSPRWEIKVPAAQS